MNTEELWKVIQKWKGVTGRVFSGENLRAKAARGGAWLGSGSFAEQLSRFVRNMLLTRLLAPSAFGAMAIVLSSSSLVASFSDVGLWPAVIQNPRGDRDEYLNVAWWMGIGRAIFIYAVVFAAAPWIASFYGNPDLVALLRVALLGTVLDGLLSPRAKLAHKQMKFGRWALINNGGGICGVILTIVLSFVLRDVWALAIGYCSENAFRCLFSYILFPGLPSVKWDRQAGRELMNFSKGMLGLAFFNLIFTRADVFVLGKMVPSATLGIYTMAVYLVQTPSGFLINLLGAMLLPALAHVQSDRERANRILSEVTSWVILLGLPVVTTIWLCRSALLTVVYGARYEIGAGALALAAGVALLNTLNALVTTVFFAAGHPALHRRAVAASAVVMLIAIYPLCKLFGLMGGQMAALLAIVASYLLQAVRLRSITGMSLLRYGKALVPSLLMSAGILLGGRGLHLLGLGVRPIANIAVAAIVCMLTLALSAPVFLRIKETA